LFHFKNQSTARAYVTGSHEVRLHSFPTAIVAADNGIDVMGVDINPHVVETINLAPTPLSKENVRKPILEIFGEEAVSGRDNSNQNIFFIEPLEYLPFVFLMEQNTLVLTDSGGIQEEAPGLGKPVLVMRDTTERPEAVDAGTVKLVGTNYDLIVKEVSLLLDDEAYYISMAQANNPYGYGLACERIIEFIK
jgi:UDP-N-acetylglucosamine 2-epimerase